MHLFSLRKSNVPLRNGSYQPSVRKHPTVWKPPPLPYANLHQLLYTLFSFVHKESVNITSIRLMDGQSSRDGRVEFRVGSEWRSVCDTTFGPDEADTVCRHSGLGRAVAVYKGSLFGANTAITHPPICCIETGDVNDCVIPSDASRTCDSDEAAGVVCSGAETCELYTEQRCFCGINPSSCLTWYIIL